MREPKNIVIYSDGTGQRGGVFVDEQRSNIYKLFRATRCGPETAINPAKQAAFYDPGIGTTPKGTGFFAWIWAKIYNLLCQATGLGLTGNIIDCYAALVRMWRPGDRIYLIGFSRGAYTVRCLGGVIGLCGIPTARSDGKPLTLDMASSKAIAIEAVKRIYQHSYSYDRQTATQRQLDLLEQRKVLAARFREKYRSGDAEGANVYPHFIGVFDTVAALASLGSMAVLGLLALGLAALLALAGLWIFPAEFGYGGWLWRIVAAMAGLGLIGGLWTRIRWEFGLPKSRLFHLLGYRMKFYDTTLNPKVGMARHALAVDERRSAFEHVAWEAPANASADTGWFEQCWFAGCHSDIGGSYPEEESRLSDISLDWMLTAAKQAGLQVDDRLMNLYPDFTGPQHDEARKLPFRWAAKIDRQIVPEAVLHPTIEQRYRHSEVFQFDVYAAYRPPSLKGRFPDPDAAAGE